jgi:hypothetical protein
MTGFKMTGFKLIAAAFALTAGMAMPAASQAQAASGIKVAMAMPMHADSKMVRHGKRHMSHQASAKDTAKDGDRYGMK